MIQYDIYGLAIHYKLRLYLGSTVNAMFFRKMRYPLCKVHYGSKHAKKIAQIFPKTLSLGIAF